MLKENGSEQRGEINRASGDYDVRQMAVTVDEPIILKILVPFLESMGHYFTLTLAKLTDDSSELLP